MLNRLPPFQAIVQVYAVVVVMFCGWTLIAFLWKLSAWLLVLNLGEIFVIFSYAMMANLIESLLVMALLLAAYILLPFPVFRRDFVVHGTILAVGIIAAMMAYVGLHMQFGIESGGNVWIGPVVVSVGTLLFLSLSSKVRFLPNAIFWISDRLTIFLFILLPLFVILSAYVIFRNIG
jgi:hypothetical protein